MKVTVEAIDAKSREAIIRRKERHVASWNALSASNVITRQLR